SKAVAKNSNTLTFSYYKDGNNLGLIENVTDQTGRSVSYAYENRRLITIIEPDGAVRKFTYDSENRIKDVINPRGITSITNEYDCEGKTVKQSFPDSSVMTYEYDDEQKTCTATEQNGNKVIYT
ncbi:RHS repeat protein, partial [Pseudobutyrivibrio ruminis]